MQKNKSHQHYSVMLDEIIGFAPQECKVFIDFTLGRAGHSEQILERKEVSTFFGVDRDEEAIEFSQEKLATHESEKHFLNLSFSEALEELTDKGVQADYVIADLGISSPQVDNVERGFSFRSEASLDMRMDKRQKKSAETVVNEYSKEELFQIIRNYGEDKFAGSISKNICLEREKNKIETTTQLAEIARYSIPRKFQGKKIHPATKTFQAIRIEVNDELEEIKSLLSGVLNIIKPGGRLAIISFHSLEDRLVKRAVKEWLNLCVCPPQMPKCVCDNKPLIAKLHSKIITPSKEELALNPRSRSAKLRVIEKL